MTTLRTAAWETTPSANSANLIFFPIKLIAKCRQLEVKGTLSRGFLRFWVEIVLKFKLNTFSRWRWRIGDFFRKNLKHQPDVFKLQSIPIVANHSQTHLIIVSENW